MKKTLTMTIISVLWISSVAFAYYSGHSNIGSYYPSFNGYLPFDATYEEVGRYIDEGQAYINACDNDIKTIINARDDAVRAVNREVERWKMNH